MQLSFQHKGKDIVAVLDPGNGELTGEILRDRLEAESFLDYFVLDKNIEHLFHQQHASRQRITVKIAERRDFQIEINVSPDKLLATISVKPAYGGREPELEDLIAALREHKIYYGVLPEALDRILVDKKTDHLPVARGKPPIDGTDAKFQPLLLEPSHQGKPRILDSGKTNFHDLQLMTTVDEGQLLMKKIPPTEGKPGMNVHKELIQQKKGKDRSFGVGKGSKMSPYDPNLLLSAQSGQIKVHSNFVSVEPVFRVDTIGYQTGNVFFPGTVEVDSDVSSHFKITATGDILVSGTVEAAELHANGEIFLHSGVVGNKQAFISAGGNIQAKFVESSRLQSLGSIIISDMLLNSEVTAAHEISVGTSGTKGQILGGNVRARHTIRAKVLGGPSNTPTLIEVGVDPALYRQLDDIQEQLQRYKTRLDEMVKCFIHSKVNKVSQNLTDALERLREVLLIRIHELTEKETQVRKTIQSTASGRVIVSEQIFAGVTVRMGEYSRTFNTNFPGATLYLNPEKGEIVLGTQPTPHA